MAEAIAVALNPAVDRTIMLDSLLRGELNRAKTVRIDPGGKGINVARVARRLGVAVRTAGLLPVEGSTLIRSCLEAEGIPGEFLEVPGEVRCNLKIVEADGTQTEINEPGPEVSAAIGSQVIERLAAGIEPGDAVVLAGSLPRGLEPDYYATLITALKARGALVVLDADGEAMRLGVAAGPMLVKPNLQEAAALLGRELNDARSVLRAAEAICSLGAQVTIVSLGAEGSILVSPQGRWRATAPCVEVKGTVGSGDAMVAGLVWGLLRGAGPETMLRLATAAGTASASKLGTASFSMEDVRIFESAVRIERISDV